jgi:hypothetical protein
MYVCMQQIWKQMKVASRRGKVLYYTVLLQLQYRVKIIDY